jgi:hypothetical protein
MNLPRLLLALTVVNLGLLAFLVGRIRSAEAGGVEPVLRGRKLEIVDDRGRVRASIIVQPPGRMPNGESFPENVMFRLIDANGRPEVKLGGSEQGAGIGFIGATDETHVLLEAKGTATSLKLTDGDGRERLLKP